MTLKQLRYLVALGKERNFTRAAARCNVAQPAFSRQVRSLEDELGVALVDRTTRRVALTQTGLEFAEKTERILDELDDARESVAQRTRLDVGRIDFGMTPTPGPFNAAATLGAFRARYPRVELAVQEDLSFSLAERLRRDELDLAVVSDLPEQARAGLTCHVLARERLEAILPPGHPFAGRKRVRLKDLRGEAFVAFPTGATIRTAMEDLARSESFELNIAFESSQPARVREFVHEGLGVALLPTSDSAAPGADVVRAQIYGPTLVHEVFVAWRNRRRLGPASAALVAAMRAEYVGGAIDEAGA